MAIRPRVRNLYYLKLVEPKNKQINALEFKRKAVGLWIDDLPIVNMGMVTRQLHDKFKRINDTRIDLLEQFETLEALQPIYYSVETFLHSKICGHSLPLTEKAQKIVELQIHILQDYATAYWYILKTGPNQLSNRVYAKLLPILIQRLLRLLSNILITHYLAHLSEPTWIWMDIHSLFNILPTKNSENTKIKAYSISGEINSTIADTYKQAIALSTADPFGMYDREILHINHFLSQWVSAIKLEKISPGLIPLGYFVSMDTDKAPSWANIDVDLDEDSDIYQIFMDDIIKTMLKETNVTQSNLGRYFAATTFPITDNTFDSDLLKHIQRQWEGIPARQPVTFDSSLHREVAIGLRAICHVMQCTDEQATSSLFRAEVAAGKSLKCSLDSETQVAIGSLVGYRKVDSENQHFGLGLVSRMSTPNSESATLFELKNITNRIEAVTIELVVNNQQVDKQDSESLKTVALSFRKQLDAGERNYLIVESRTFKANDTIIVHDANRSYGAILLKQNNLGLGYVIVEYQSIQEAKRLEAIPVTGYDFL